MRCVVLIFMYMTSITCNAQTYGGPDALWGIGIKNPFEPNEPWGTEYFDFTGNSMNNLLIQNYVESYNTTSCLSVNSELAFYTNGLHVYDKNLQLMENGIGLNPGEVHNHNSIGGYPVRNGMFSVFRPGHKASEIDLIHMGIEYSNCPGAFLYHTQIDLKANNGLGKVLFKNRIIATGPFKYGGLAACRHANGRDWWFAINPCDQTLKVFLLGPDGPKYHHTDSILQAFGYPTCQAVYSPDGKFFALHTFGNEKSEVHLLDFDRCTGRFSNHRVWYYRDETSLNPSHQPTVGVAISQNSRFMYIISREKIHQYDLESTDIPASDQVVAVYDGYMDKYAPTVFSFAHLAPDGKIYIIGRSTLFKIHVIDQPDLKGIACNVKQHAIDLTFPNQVNMPYFPYFRLSAESATICDSLITSNEYFEKPPGISVYPNPANDRLYFSNTGNFKIIMASIVDIHGKIALDFEIKSNQSKDVSGLPAGIYFLRLVYNNTHTVIQKIVIQ